MDNLIRLVHLVERDNITAPKRGQFKGCNLPSQAEVSETLQRIIQEVSLTSDEISGVNLAYFLGRRVAFRGHGYVEAKYVWHPTVFLFPFYDEKVSYSIHRGMQHRIRGRDPIFVQGSCLYLKKKEVLGLTPEGREICSLRHLDEARIDVAVLFSRNPLINQGHYSCCL